MPVNYKALFAFGHEICKCHNKHLTYNSILEHNRID